MLGNDEAWKTRFLIDQYCILGLTGFKVKLSGVLADDRQKLRSLAELTAWHGVAPPRVRVDANNLWATAPGEALPYLQALDGQAARQTRGASRCRLLAAAPISLLPDRHTSRNSRTSAV